MATLPNQGPKPDAPLWAQPAWVDTWTIKCLYNKSDYPAKVAERQFAPLHRAQSKIRNNGERTVSVYYGLEIGRRFRVVFQWFENEAGEITRSREKEPKRIFIEGADYHSHTGNRWWERIRREPEKALPIVAWKKRYGAWRKRKCDLYGPVEARRKVSPFLGLRRSVE